MGVLEVCLVRCIRQPSAHLASKPRRRHTHAKLGPQPGTTKVPEGRVAGGDTKAVVVVVLLKKERGLAPRLFARNCRLPPVLG